jgi:DNA recombination protein RmuC
MEGFFGLETTLLAAFLSLVVLAAVIGAALIFALTRRPAGRPSEGVALLQQQLTALRSELASYLQHQSTQLEQAHETMGERLDRASTSVSEVRQQLGVLEQATERVLEVGKSVAGIENLLRAPKLRGVLGEVLLAELLRQVLPPSLFHLQHPLRSGERVDAAVQVGDHLLPIDAKFPLENLRRADEASGAERESYQRAFARDFRRHVDAIASKYIAPDQGTLPMAFLYVPAENVYQQAILGDWKLAEYAVSRHVVPMGPLGLYAFLQSALLGSRTVAVPARAREILAGLEQIALELRQLEDEMSKLGRHLGLARGSLEQLGKRSVRLSETVDRARSTLDAAPVAERSAPGDD